MRQPMLAAKTTDADLRKVKYPVVVSPKIDGIRAICFGGRLLSRSMKPIPNLATQLAFGRPELEGLDGELVVGQPNDPNLMQQTTSGVMAYEDDPRARWYVFDKFDEVGGFGARNYQAGLFCMDQHHVIFLEHHQVASYADLLMAEEHYLTQGYEGIMIRSLTGPYKQGRSTLKEGYLLKVKRFTDSEAIVLSLNALERNFNDQMIDERGYQKRSTRQEGQQAVAMLGSITCRDLKTGVEFNMGSGFTESQRSWFWDNPSKIQGKIVKYKFQAHGVKDKPRMPIFLGIRDGRDL